MPLSLRTAASLVKHAHHVRAPIHLLVGLAIIVVKNHGQTPMGVPAYWQLVVKDSILRATVVYDELRYASQEDTRSPASMPP